MQLEQKALSNQDKVSLHYNQKYLTARTSESFLEDCTYKVNLNQLYQIKSSCAYHEDMPYTPIMVQVQPDLLKFYNGAKYLLQVWSQDAEKIYERPLQAEVQMWNIFFKYLIYKPQSPDQDSDCYHLVNLENGNSIYLIEDFVKDPNYKYLAYNDNTLYIANHKEILVYTLIDDLGQGEVARYKVNTQDIGVINPDNNKIHGLYINNEGYYREKYILAVIETYDNQVDFSSVHIIKRPLGKDFEYQLKQFREIVPRDVSLDPIKKFKAIFQKNALHDFNFSIAIRQSGKFDLYFNAFRVFSSIDGETAVDGELSFDTLYLKMENNQLRSIDLKHQSRISLENSELDNRVNLNTVFFQNIKRQCKIYTGFCLIKTYVIVFHNHILSEYHVLKNDKNWVKHIEFNSKIISVFRVLGNQDIDAYVLLEDGSIKLLKCEMQQLVDSDGQKKGPMIEIWVPDSDIALKIKGQLLKFDQDREFNKFAFFLTQEDNNIYCQVLSNRTLYDITSMLPQLTNKHNVITIFSGEEITQFVVQNKQQVTLYDIQISNNTPIINKLQEFSPIPQLENDSLHAGIRFLDGKHLFLIDHHNFYEINLSNKVCTTYLDQNAGGIFFSDQTYLYTLSHKSMKRRSGFKLYDLANVVEKQQDLCYHLTSVQIGCQGQIDFSLANQRLVYLSSYDYIDIVPMFHRNTITFIGMQKRQMQIGGRMIKDQFIALNNKNRLLTWDVLTGKLKHQQLISQDYSNFEVFQFKQEDQVYKKEWYSKILIKSKTPIKDYDENRFFDPSQTKTHIDKQVSFIKKTKKEFFEFKIIEIVSNTQVVEHCTFIHPYYGGSLQYIYFSEDGEHMYERLINQRLFLYKKTPAKGQSGNMITWEMIHRFTSFPSDLLDTTQHQLVFTPDFSQYIDVNRKTQTFIIRDSYSQREICVIPEMLMNLKNQNMRDIINRFAWIDNNTFKIISEDGIERIVDIKNDFKEIEFNVIPMFDKELCKKNHIIIDRPSPSAKDTVSRLIKKYQDYKTGYYLEKKRTPEQLYQTLFDVDFGVQKCNERWVSNLSFTFLHWKLIEQLELGNLHIEDIDHSEIRALIYNILPGGDTFLHKLSTKNEILEKIFQIAHPNEEDRTQVQFHVPFLKNFEHQSPMSLFALHRDYRSMNMMLEYLSAYGIDHHSRAISDQIPIMIEHDLPNLQQYLDSRLQQTEQSKQFTRGMIREVQPYGIVTAPFWFGLETLHQLFQEAPIEQELKIQFVDIPKIHTYTHEVSQEFFEALADTENMSFFDRKIVQKVIEYKWPLTKKYVIQKLFIPFLVFQFLYLIYMNGIYFYRNGVFNAETNQMENVTSMAIINLIFQAILGGYGVYFCYTECCQLLKEGLGYFTSIWNYLDLIPPIFIVIFIALDNIGWFDNGNAALEGSLQATMSLCIWLKFLYFLRIFQSTGYLIRIIIQVFQEMRFFLFILLLTIVAFGDSLLQLSYANKDGEEFIQGGFLGGISYSYRMILGDFSTDYFGSIAVPYVWVLFILCTVVNMIIMINLLIAIISEAFLRINSVSMQASYQEKASMIAENSYLIPQYKKKEFCQENVYLLLATDVDAELDGRKDPIDEKLQKLEHGLHIQIQEMLNKKIGNLNQSVEEVRGENKAILELLQQLVSQKE